MKSRAISHACWLKITDVSDVSEDEERKMVSETAVV
jgi:hypothetical protein